MPKRVAHVFEEKWRSKDVALQEDADFSTLLLSDKVLKGLRKAGFKKPSPIQLEAIPVGRYGKDLIVQAKAGTGKTLVFTIVALETLVDLNLPQVLILAPTREVATQICDVINSVGSSFKHLKCCSFIGGIPVENDIENMHSCQIVVGTPGRIKQLMDMKALRTASIRLLIFDEVDHLLGRSFMNEIDFIFSALPKDKQVIVTSATYPKALTKLLPAFLRDPYIACLTAHELALLGTVHYLQTVKYSQMSALQYKIKVEALEKILTTINFSQCLVFCNLISRVECLCGNIKKWGFTTTYISSAKEQEERLKAIERLKRFKCKVLVSSDLTSRGIDAENVDLIINFDMPFSTEVYLHRVGRAGRYGSKGIAITLVTEEQELSFEKIEYEAKFKAYQLPDPIPADLIEQPSPSLPTETESSDNDADVVGVGVNTDIAKHNFKRKKSKHIHSESKRITNDFKESLNHVLCSHEENAKEICSESKKTKGQNKSKKEELNVNISENGYIQDKVLHCANEVHQLNIKANQGIANDVGAYQSNIIDELAHNQCEILNMNSEISSDEICNTFEDSSLKCDLPAINPENDETTFEVNGQVVPEDLSVDENSLSHDNKPILNSEIYSRPKDVNQNGFCYITNNTKALSSFSDGKPANELKSKSVTAETCVKTESLANYGDPVPSEKSCAENMPKGMHSSSQNESISSSENICNPKELKKNGEVTFSVTPNSEKSNSEPSVVSSNFDVSASAINSTENKDKKNLENIESVLKSQSKLRELDIVLDFVQQYEARDKQVVYDTKSKCIGNDNLGREPSNCEQTSKLPSEPNDRNKPNIISSDDIKSLRSKYDIYYYNVLKNCSGENMNNDSVSLKDESVNELISGKCNLIDAPSTAAEIVSAVALPLAEQSSKSTSDNYISNIDPSPLVKEVPAESNSEQNLSLNEQSILSSEPQHESTPITKWVQKNGKWYDYNAVSSKFSLSSSESEYSDDENASSTHSNKALSGKESSESHSTKALDGPSKNLTASHISKKTPISTSSNLDVTVSDESEDTLSEVSLGESEDVSSQSSHSKQITRRKKFYSRRQFSKPLAKAFQKKEHTHQPGAKNKPVQSSNIKYKYCGNENFKLCSPQQHISNCYGQKQQRNEHNYLYNNAYCQSESSVHCGNKGFLECSYVQPNMQQLSFFSQPTCHFNNGGGMARACDKCCGNRNFTLCSPQQHISNCYGQKQQRNEHNCSYNNAYCHFGPSMHYGNQSFVTCSHHVQPNMQQLSFVSQPTCHFNKGGITRACNCFMPSQRLCCSPVNCSAFCNHMSACAQWHHPF